MKYTFKCPQCQESQDIELSVKEYSEYKAICERCKVKMERVYEMPQVRWGDSAEKDKGSDSSSDLSCAGSCSSCAGCGD